MSDGPTRIMVVDDNLAMAATAKVLLENAGFEVTLCDSPIRALEEIPNQRPDCVLLDIMMPEMDGIEACEILRGTPGMESTIITFLTARGEDYSQVAGFDAGADDYITKPIKPKVLVSKVNALLRRIKNEENAQEDITKVGDIVINREEYKIIKKGKEIILPRKEFELLSLLVSKPGKVFTREVIYHSFWG